MGNIATTDARGLFTKTLIDVYRERAVPTAFLRSFFPTDESVTKEISIEVQRGTEKVAVDVVRGTEGNRNTFTKSTEKIFIPPLYREFFNAATELSLYDRAFGSSQTDSGLFAALAQEGAEKLMSLKDKIERAYEKQCSEVFETGIVTLRNGINIDFKRKAASVVDLNASSGYWTTGSNNPYTAFQTACEFIRQKGKSQGGTFNAIFGTQAWNALLANTTFKDRQDLISLQLDSVRPPQRDSVGAVLHGTITAGSYKINCWTYPEFYDNADSVSTAYVNEKKVIVLPENPRFKLSFAAVPQLLEEGQPPKKGAYLIGEYRDPRKVAHDIDIQSAGVALPVAVDQIFTMKAIA